LDEAVHLGNAEDAQEESSGPARLLRQPLPQGEQWVLIAGPTSRVLLNSSPLALGIAALADRDEIVVPGPAPGDERHLFFTSERPSNVESLPEGLNAACPRCRDTLEPGTPAVCCPACGVWHHQREDRPCWTYAETCAACLQQRTALDGGFHWTPAEL
jgi:hypothetical protein